MNNSSINFFDKWKAERKAGFLEYYKRNVGGVTMIMIGIFVAACLGEKINIMYLIISMSVALLFPAFAWGINELRWIIYNKKWR